MANAITFLLLASTVFCCQAAPVDSHGRSDLHCPLNIKILDALKGAPAGNVVLKVFRQSADQTWEKLTTRNTNEVGEVHDLLSEQDFIPGVYRVEFDTKAYWNGQGRTPFHEVAEVVFESHAEGHRHYTLALLLSPFSYTTTAVVGKGHD
ncbi:Transthyretin [Bagarius yarrelli]|uniref:Transthyretin n=1 Tax=Bagarius yarrelli TaxID=175774 RepID=A0A556TSX7_BAGYA|nr:Transthyretin [Bagarius yarrelli]